jgi:hypothetical protein
MLIFLAVMDLGEGGTVLDSVAQPGLAFALFVASFFDTSTFHFLIATYEASEPGRGRGAYDTPIFSRTRFKQPPFGIFAILRASCSFSLKLPNTF